MEVECSSETSSDFQRTIRAKSHKKNSSLNYRYENLVSKNIVVIATTDVVVVVAEAAAAVIVIVVVVKSCDLVA
jgi:hypothetical protein